MAAKMLQHTLTDEEADQQIGLRTVTPPDNATLILLRNLQGQLDAQEARLDALESS